MYTFLLYAMRWQLSSPILALCLYFMSSLGVLWSTVVANFIGAAIFFFVDKKIFNPLDT